MAKQNVFNKGMKLEVKSVMQFSLGQLGSRTIDAGSKGMITNVRKDDVDFLINGMGFTLTKEFINNEIAINKLARI